MSDHVYKHIDVTGSSKTSSDDAVRRAISKAGESIRGMRGFKVVETRQGGVAPKPSAEV
jgi:flavin-binding protein dodecin